MLHHRLILKLKAYGICGNPHLWLSNFLSNRVQRVLVNGCSSDWVGVQSGVHQGSVLGPLLFILYVNDMPDLILSNMRMFADDTKIYSVIRNFDDCLRLQKDLDQLSQWSRIWLLQFNAAKCKIIRIGNSVPVTYSMEDSVSNISTDLEAVDQEKDLGVWCTSSLKPFVQCQKVSSPDLTSTWYN